MKSETISARQRWTGWSRMTPSGIITSFLLLLPAVAAHASPLSCAAGPLSGVLGTQCTIGDMIFTFNSYSINASTSDVPGGTIQPGSNSAPAATDVFFTPTVDPTYGPGFRLTADFWSTVAVPAPIEMEVSAVIGSLEFAMAPSVPGATALWMTTQANDASVATILDSSCIYSFCSAYAEAAATTELYLESYEAAGGIVEGRHVDGVQQWVPYVPNSVLVNSYIGDTAIARVWVDGELYADPGINASHDGHTSASLTSGDFWFQQTTTAPEPATWALLGAACVPLLAWQRRRRQR